MAGIDRRTFLRGALAAAALPLLGRPARAASLPAGTVALLGTSPYVYVSPLRKDGQESTCHGEVWFAWLDGQVVLITARDRWKARSTVSGSGTARIWVGDHGRWKGVLGRNEDFRKAPHFDARARIVKDDALLDRLIAAYEKKYPDEIAKWRDRFRSGYASGERVLVVYEPLAS